MDDLERQQVRQARGKFLAMAATFALGVFNDNFFKQTAMLIVPAVLRDRLQGWATIAFTFPFVVLAAHAGWMADRFRKRHVVIGAKVMELVAMVFGAVGVLRGDWTLMLIMLAIMGTQAAVFSPALAGSIPELYPASHVTRANGYMKVASTVSILAGVAAAGLALDMNWTTVADVPLGQVIVAAGVLAIAVVGLGASLGVPNRPPASPKALFPWSGPLRTLRDLWDARRDRLLITIIFADAYFWFLGSLTVLMVNSMGKDQFAVGNSMTSALVVAMMLGIAAGGLLAGRLAVGERWHRVLAPSALGMVVLMLGIAAAPFVRDAARVPSLFALLAAMGIAGGLYMVPQESFIQVRPSADRKGTIIAAGNFVAFAGILISGPVNWAMSALPPTARFAVLAAPTLAVALWLRLALPRASQGAPGD